MISAERLSDVFVTVADTLVDDFDLIDFLHVLTNHAAAIGGADAAGIVLGDARGRLQFMAASNEAGRTMELFQLQSQEGPCRECFTTGQPVVNVDLASAHDLWPTFAPLAVEAGFATVHAFPMRLRDDTIGALNLFNRVSPSLDEQEQRVVRALADVATIAILQERSIARAEELTEQLQGALTSRIVIEQAKGALAQARGIGIGEAFDLMRSHARSSRRRLTDVADAVLRGDLPPS